MSGDVRLTDAERTALARVIRPWTMCDDGGRFDHGSQRAAQAVLAAGYARTAEAPAFADAQEALARVEALHQKVENPRHGCCAPPKLCEGHAPECDSSDHGMLRPRWPCATLRAAALSPTAPDAGQP